MTLLESNQKKHAFLEKTKIALNLKEIFIKERIAEKSTVKIGLIKAVTSLKSISYSINDMIDKKGSLIVFKGTENQTEEREFKKEGGSFEIKKIFTYQLTDFPSPYATKKIYLLQKRQ